MKIDTNGKMPNDKTAIATNNSTSVTPRGEAEVRRRMRRQPAETRHILCFNCRHRIVMMFSFFSPQRRGARRKMPCPRVAAVKNDE